MATEFGTRRMSYTMQPLDRHGRHINGGHIHTLVTSRVRCPGMAIVGLIDDPDARAEALVRERHAAQRYEAAVTYAIRTAAVTLARGGDRGTKTTTAERYRISRVTLDKWLAEDVAGTVPSSPWEPERTGNGQA